MSLSVVATGCGTVRTMMDGSKVDYKSAGRLPPLEVPPDLTRPTGDDRFIVPDINPSGSATYSAYAKDRAVRPANANTEILPKVDNVTIERAGTQRWLVVQRTPAQLWPTVKAFWQEIGFLVDVDSPETGVMETDWAESRPKLDDGVVRNALSKLFGSISSTSERDKFRTRLESDASRNSTEIYISHRGLMEVFENTTGESKRVVWQPRPSDPSLEAEMLRRLMIRLGVQEARAKETVQSAALAPRARISRGPDGFSNLVIDDQFDRAWRRVGLALDRVGFTVEDRDRSKGLYFVRYVDPDADARNKKDTGILSKLAFWRSDSSAKNRNAQFRIAVKENGQGAQVNIMNKDGQAERSETANRILALLHDQLK
jgi:outer membrane protein assembly factor BamC